LATGTGRFPAADHIVLSAVSLLADGSGALKKLRLFNPGTLRPF